MRTVHLGLGAFARSHTLLYSALAARLTGAERVGVVGFTGSRPDVADALRAADLTYHVLERGQQGASVERVRILDDVHPGRSPDAWRDTVSDAATTAITVTVTEKAYLVGADGRLALDHPQVRHDVAALRVDVAAPLLQSVPGRLAQAALLRASDEPFAIVSCDNMPANGTVVRSAVEQLLDAAGFDAAEVTSRLHFPDTAVDRITPATTPEDHAAARALIGHEDPGLVSAEPYREWIIGADMHDRRPRWEDVGARFVADVGPFEHRKLHLLNAAHSLLAYCGLAAGHVSVAQAVSDPVIRTTLRDWWASASRLIEGTEADDRGYTDALLARFENPAIEHRLAQIAQDGSIKLRARMSAVLEDASVRGVAAPESAARTVAAWTAGWRARAAWCVDPATDRLRELSGLLPADAIARALGMIAPAAADDAAFVATCVSELASYERAR